MILVVLCNIFFLFLYIHKQNWFIQLTYARQKNEQKLIELQKKIKETKNLIHQQQNPQTIKNVAEKNLLLKKANLKQMHALNNPDDLTPNLTPGLTP